MPEEETDWPESWYMEMNVDAGDAQKNENRLKPNKVPPAALAVPAAMPPPRYSEPLSNLPDHPPPSCSKPPWRS